MTKAMGMNDAKEPLDFITMLVKLQEECRVANLKMSDYDIKLEEFKALAKKAKETMAKLFTCDRSELSIEDCIKIYQESYK